MAFFFFPHRHLTQPTGPVQINWSHPLARGLVFYQIANRGGAPDLVSGNTPFILGTARQTVGSKGAGFQSQNTTTDGWGTTYSRDRFRTISSQYTMACQVDIASFTGNSKLISVPYYSASWFQPYAAISIARNGSTNQAMIGQTNATADNSEKIFFPANTFVAGGGQSFVAVRDGTTGSLLLNGTRYSAASSSVVSDVVWGSGDHVALMTRSRGIVGEGTQGTCYYAAIWNRALTDDEQSAFQKAPYQLLRTTTFPTYYSAIALEEPVVSTRFYLPSTGTASISPPFDSAWNDTSSVVTRPASTSRGSSAFAEVSDAETSSSNQWDVCLGRFVSEPLAAQTIAGNVMGIIRARESNAGANARSQMVIRVVSDDGATVRGTLLAQNNTTTNINEWVATTTVTAARNARFPVGSGFAALTPVVTQQGDRIVIEVGGHAVNTSTTSYTLGLRFGENSATELTNDETGTAEGTPWIEFDSALLFYAAPASQNVTVTAAAKKPSISATSTQVYPARAITAAAAATKPTAAATVTQTFPARSVTGVVVAKKPVVAAAAVQQFPSRDLTASAVAPKPTSTATVVSSRTVQASAATKKPSAAATVQQTFPARSITAAASAKKPTAVAAAVQQFPARNVAGSVIAAKPTAAVTAEQEFTERYVEAAIDAPKPTASATVVQSTIGSVSVFGSAEAARPIATATAIQVFPARAVSASVLAPKPTASAATLTTRKVTAAAVSPKPTATAAAGQTYPERNVSGLASVKKPILTATATHPYPAHTVTAAAMATKPTASATAIQVRGVSTFATAPKPTAVATATQVYPPRFLTASAAAKKPTAEAFVEQIFPARSVDAIAFVNKPTIQALVKHGPSPGAAHIANTVRLTGSIDMDVLISGAIETDIAMTGVIEQ